MTDISIGAEHGDTPAYQLHSVNSVTAAAFLGGPLAAGIVMGINYRRLGRRDAARIAVGIGVVATVLLLALLFMLPDALLDRIPNAAIAVPLLFAASTLAKRLQGDAIEGHIARGGAMASMWRSVGIGALCMPVVLGGAFALVYLSEPDYGAMVTFGNDEVYYMGDATEQDARKLADVLKAAGWFGGVGTSMQLDASGGRYTVSFVVAEPFGNDSAAVAHFRMVGAEIVAAGFPSPLNVRLCNDRLVPLETFVVK